MSRVGILGGTFDPPHNAHLAMAKAARERIPLDRVLLMPAPNPPHKPAGRLTPYEMRRQMARLLVSGQPGLELSRLEEFREGASYTVDLLRHYRDRFDDELFLILGADSVADMPAWREPRAILELATIVVFPRTGYASYLPVAGEAAIILFEEPVIDVSSSGIRDVVRAGEPVPELVPAAVAEFILDNSLYT